MSGSRNKVLDCLKGFASIGVIFIHIPFPGRIGELIKLLCAFAVPVFYMTAGYYSYNVDESTIKRRLVKIARIFVLALSIYFFYELGMAIRENEAFEWLGENFTFMALIKLVVFCTIEFAIPIWYLIAQIETYFLWYFVVKYNKESTVVKILPVLFLLQVISVTICDTIGTDWYLKMNFITRALPWFGFGYYIRSVSRERIQKIENKYLYICVAIGAMITVMPQLLKLPVQFNSIGYILLAPALFIMAEKEWKILYMDMMYFIGKNLSLWIYIFHVIIGKIIDSMISKYALAVYSTGIYRWCRPIIVVVSTVIFAYCFDLIYKKIKFRK